MQQTQGMMPQKEEDKAFLWKNIGRLAWPCAVEQLFSCLISTISTTLVSSIGKEAVNAVSICNQPMYIPNVVLQAFNVGGTALIARFLGMQDKKNAKKACSQTLFLSMIISLFAAVALYFGGGVIIRMLGAGDDYYGLACTYMRFVAVGLVFQSISTSVAAMLRGSGKTSLSMYFNILASIVNVVVGYLLIHVADLGVVGAGIAFVAAQASGSMFALYLLFFRKDLDIHITPAQVLHPQKEVIRRIGNVGFSTALEQLALRIGMIIFTSQIVGLGTSEYAAHNITNNIDNYSLAFAMALSVALTSLVGQNLGAGKPDLAEKYIKEALKIGLICSSIFVGAFLLVPQWIARIFSNEQAVIDNIIKCLFMLALVTPGQLLQIAICGGLRGGGDTRWPLISSMTGILGVRTVLTLVFVQVLDLGLVGAWAAMALDQNLRAFIIYRRYRSGKWKTIRV